MPSIASAQTATGGSIIPAIIMLVCLIILFFILRNLVLWYWGVSDIRKNQQTQIDLLREISAKLNNLSPNSPPTPNNSNNDNLHQY